MSNQGTSSLLELAQELRDSRAQNVELLGIAPELKPGCPPVFQGVTEAEMAEMTPEQREFLGAWG